MFDEMLDGQESEGREPYRPLLAWLKNQDFRKLSKQSLQAEELFRRIGITFNVYGAQDGEERIIPCLLYTSPSPRDRTRSRMPSSA